MRSTAPWIALTGAVLLAGCAAMNSLSTDVSSFGEWPADRKPGSYAFERLPSQQARAAEADALEAAAQGALLKAGFTAAAPGAEPDVLVQVGARSSLADYQAWDDPLWWRGGFGYWRYGPWVSPRWAMSARYDFPRYEREVAVLIRDRASGKPLFEARASSEGNARAGAATLAAMFEAALMDFPRLGMNPRRVVVPLPG
ncbi:MAG: DUF4136 domain-containing protein [Rubrivivax sp.]|nr:DUF4136 domain-containing protein [Rubrivivax sp.]